MNSKIERLDKLLEAAVITNNKEIANPLVVALMQEWSKEIANVIQPVTAARIPFIVATLELYAKALRDEAPFDVNAGIDDLKRIPIVIIKTPVKGDHDE